jgi:hypothetical protein
MKNMALRSIGLLAALAGSFVTMNAQAAIFTCKGADGSRVFSDTPCEDAKKAGEDAKAAAPKGVEAKQPSAIAPSKSSEPSLAQSDRASTNQPAPSTSVEFKEAQTKCKQGQKSACEDATRLAKRNDEMFREQLQRGCDRGSDTECEELYCRSGISKQCRDVMTKTSALVGSNWYIKKQAASVRPPGSGEYVHAVICDPKAQVSRDTTVYCSGETTHCGSRFEPKKVKTLEAAADYACARH